MTITGPARTLYVSDLDDTLFSGADRLSDVSTQLLQRAIDGGTAFTVATARSPLTALRALGALRLQQPFIAYGGATAVSPEGEHLWWRQFDARALHPLIGASLAAGVTPLVFWLQDGVDRIAWVRGAETTGVDAFVDARTGDPRLAPVDGWDEIDHEHAFFVSIVGEYPVLRRLSRMVRAISWGAGCSLSLQRGEDDGLAVLDVTPARATKGTGVRQIADDGGYERIVAFGDGSNDLPLFAEADEAYAVATASDDAKAAATGVIGGVGQDAVARFLAERIAQEV